MTVGAIMFFAPLAIAWMVLLIYLITLTIKALYTGKCYWLLAMLIIGIIYITVATGLIDKYLL